MRLNEYKSEVLRLRLECQFHWAAAARVRCRDLWLAKSVWKVCVTIALLGLKCVQGVTETCARSSPPAAAAARALTQRNAWLRVRKRPPRALLNKEIQVKVRSPVLMHEFIIARRVKDFTDVKRNVQTHLHLLGAAAGHPFDERGARRHPLLFRVEQHHLVLKQAAGAGLREGGGERG